MSSAASAGRQGPPNQRLQLAGAGVCCRLLDDGRIVPLPGEDGSQARLYQPSIKRTKTGQGQRAQYATPPADTRYPVIDGGHLVGYLYTPSKPTNAQEQEAVSVLKEMAA